MITEHSSSPEPISSASNLDVAPKADDKVKVLYIGGQGRSGSTLLGRLMGEVDGCVNVGEVVYIWQPFLEDLLCSCGSKFHSCPFWSEVVRIGFGSTDNIDAKLILRTKKRLERIRTLPRLLSPIRTAEDREGVAYYLEFLGKLYAAMREVSGGRVIVDGSKSPLYSYFLRQVPNIDLRIFHLVRDSRAVTHSWQRRKLNPAFHWKEAHYGTYSPTYSAAEWWAQNEIISTLGRRNKHFANMRYEDVASDPVKAITRICELLDEPTPDLEFLKQSPIQLNVHHMANGNPDRFTQTINLKPDLEWQEKMKPSHRFIVTAMTWPLLLKYGYKI
jgi:hypothetical protein